MPISSVTWEILSGWSSSDVITTEISADWPPWPFERNIPLIFVPAGAGSVPGVGITASTCLSSSVNCRCSCFWYLLSASFCRSKAFSESSSFAVFSSSLFLCASSNSFAVFSFTFSFSLVISSSSEKHTQPRLITVIKAIVLTKVFIFNSPFRNCSFHSLSKKGFQAVRGPVISPHYSLLC